MVPQGLWPSAMLEGGGQGTKFSRGGPEGSKQFLVRGQQQNAAKKRRKIGKSGQRPSSFPAKIRADGLSPAAALWQKKQRIFPAPDESQLESVLRPPQQGEGQPDFHWGEHEGENFATWTGKRKEKKNKSQHRAALIFLSGRQSQQRVRGGPPYRCAHRRYQEKKTMRSGVSPGKQTSPDLQGRSACRIMRYRGRHHHVTWKCWGRAAVSLIGGSFGFWLAQARGKEYQSLLVAKLLSGVLGGGWQHRKLGLEQRCHLKLTAHLATGPTSVLGHIELAYYFFTPINQSTRNSRARHMADFFVWVLML